ncbi:YceI family protein [Pseudaestuariivita sp.]|uniref:YceI family protein n=1 Tax=Pseudaestuariivita sp. TaxID=2211669 RepID=UPI004058CE5F
MKALALATALTAATATTALADAETYVMDPSHSVIQFTWSHGDFSTTFGMFFEVGGEIQFDQDDPAASSVSASVPLGTMVVDPTLKGHLEGERWFNGYDGKMVSFTSTSIEVTGDSTAMITGDLTVGDMTQEVVLDATMNKIGDGPRGGTIAGFDATTTIMRSDFGVGAFAPFVSDEVAVEISIEASPA